MNRPILSAACVAFALVVPSADAQGTAPSVLAYDPSASTAATPIGRCEGGSVNFGVQVSGTTPMEYAWKRNGVVMTHGTATTSPFWTYYDTPTLAQTDDGLWTCEIDNAAGLTTASFYLEVQTAPSATFTAAPAAPCLGDAVLFSVDFSQGGTHWVELFRNATLVATSPHVYDAWTYVVPAWGLIDYGTWSVNVRNACSPTFATSLSILPGAAPEIVATDPPSGVYHYCVGQAGSHTIGATATGAPPLSYEWTHDGAVVGNGPTLTLNAPGLAAAGFYVVVVTNACGLTDSTYVELVPHEVPTVTLTASDPTPCPGEGVLLTATATEIGGGPYHYLWWGPGLPLTSGGATRDLTPAEIGAGGVWGVRVYTLACNDGGEATATIAVHPTPAVSVVVPVPGPCVGDPASLSVVTDAAPPYEVQWFGPTGAFAGANNPLVLGSVTLAHEGFWNVTVTDANGCVGYGVAHMDVREPPVVQLFVNPAAPCVGQRVDFTAQVAGDGPFNYLWNGPGTGFQWVPGDASWTIPAAVAGDAGLWQVSVDGPCDPDGFAGVVLPVLTPPEIVQGPDHAVVCVGDVANFAVTAQGSPPLAYEWSGPSTGGAWVQGGAAFQVGPVTPAEAGVYACRVTNACGQDVAAANLVVDVPAEIDVAPQNATGCVGDTATLTVVASGTPPPDYLWSGPRTGGIFVAGGPTFTLANLQESDAGTYTVVAQNHCPPPASATCVVAVRRPPSVVTPPASISVCAGTTAGFSVAANGTSPLTYEWSGPATGGAWVAGGAAYAIAAVDADDAGVYSVRVSNDCGTATASATLAVERPPTIVTGPSNAAPCLGAPFSLTVQATGEPPLSYAWSGPGTGFAFVPGGPTWSVASCTAADAGWWTVRVTGACAPPATASAVVAVVEPPTIIVPPTAVLGCHDESVALSVTAVGGAPLQYQWFKDGTPLDGAVGAVYVVPGLSAATAGVYAVVVYNACGAVVSTPVPVRPAAPHGRHWEAADAFATAPPFSETVRALLPVVENGASVLYAGGGFVASGGAAADYVARWDGTTWTPAGAQSFNGSVNALVVFDDGTGPALYAGGAFDAYGSTPVRHVARWDGATWTQVGDGLGQANTAGVLTLCVYDSGAGPELYAGGSFSTGSGPSKMAKWNGATWEPVGLASINNQVSSMAVHDDGTGPKLFVGGTFTNFANVLAAWDGATWTDVPGFQSGGGTNVTALRSYDDGTGSALFVGGTFTEVDGNPACRRIAKRTGSTWSALLNGLNNPVYAFEVWNDGDGEALYVGGQFTGGSGVPTQRIARWKDGVFSPLAGGLSNTVRALAVYGSGGSCGDLYAGGLFTSADGAPSAAGVARWSPDFTLLLGQTQGPGSLEISHAYGPANASVFTAISFDLLNEIAPGTGPWFGLHIDEWSLFYEFTSFAPPFVATLDGAGRSDFLLPPGVLTGLAGIKLWSNAGTFDPTTFTPGIFTAVSSLTLQ